MNLPNVDTNLNGWSKAHVSFDPNVVLAGIGA